MCRLSGIIRSYLGPETDIISQSHTLESMKQLSCVYIYNFFKVYPSYHTVQQYYLEFLYMPTHILLIALKCGCHFSKTPEGISIPVTVGVKIFIYLLVGLWQCSLCCSDRLQTMLAEKAMATHSSTLAWKFPWIEEPGRLQSMGL